MTTTESQILVQTVTEMVGVLLSLQSSLKQLVQGSKPQTEAFNNLREDILLQPDPNEDDKDLITDGTPNLLDLTMACLTIPALTKGQTTTS